MCIGIGNRDTKSGACRVSRVCVAILLLKYRSCSIDFFRMEVNPLDPLKVFVGGLRPGIVKWQIAEFLEDFQANEDVKYTDIYVKNNNNAKDDIAFIKVEKPEHAHEIIKAINNSIDGRLTDGTAEAAAMSE